MLNGYSDVSDLKLSLPYSSTYSLSLIRSQMIWSISTLLPLGISFIVLYRLSISVVRKTSCTNLSFLAWSFSSLNKDSPEDTISLVFRKAFFFPFFTVAYRFANFDLLSAPVVVFVLTEII